MRTSSRRSTASWASMCPTSASRPAAGPTACFRARARPTSPRILGALDAAGWDGLYDIEIFSDDGTFGAAYANSIWALPSNESLGRARAAFEQCWSAMPPSAASRRQTVKEWK